MLTHLGHFAVHRRRVILVAAVVVFALAGAFGGSVAEHLSSGGFGDPASESFQADAALLDTFDAGTPNLLLLVTAEDGSVDDPAVVAAGTALTEELAGEPHVTNVVSYWTLGNAPPLRSVGGDRALVLARIDGTQNEVNERVADLADYRRDGDGIRVEIGGFSEVFREVGSTIEDDLVRAESIALPITLVLLLLVFGSVVSASLPLAIGALSIVGTFAVLRMLSMLTEVSIFTLNLTTAIGLGLAIDYSLFVVSRFREELRAGHAPADRGAAHGAHGRPHRRLQRGHRGRLAVRPARLPAGLPPQLRLRRGGRGLPGRGLLRRRAARHPGRPRHRGRPPHHLQALDRRPRRGLLAPDRHLRDAAARRGRDRGDRGAPVPRRSVPADPPLACPTTACSRKPPPAARFTTCCATSSPPRRPAPPPSSPRASETRRSGPTRSTPTPPTSPTLPGVARVDAATGTYCGGGLADDLGCTPGQQVVPGGEGRYLTFSTATAGGSTYLSVVPDVEPLSAEGEALVEAIRSTDSPVPHRGHRHVGPARRHQGRPLLSAARWPLGIIALATFVLLFLMFGSVLVPIKALVLNLLSLTATFGAMVWIFQDGHLGGVARLHRHRLDRHHHADPHVLHRLRAVDGLRGVPPLPHQGGVRPHRRQRASVALGLERTGRIVTAAALLIAVVFIAFAIEPRHASSSCSASASRWPC